MKMAAFAVRHATAEEAQRALLALGVAARVAVAGVAAGLADQLGLLLDLGRSLFDARRGERGDRDLFVLFDDEGDAVRRPRSTES